MKGFRFRKARRWLFLFCLLCTVILLTGAVTAEQPEEIDFRAEQVTCLNEGLTNKKAAEGYIDRLMHFRKNAGIRERSQTISRLGEAEKKLYFLLKAEIEKVAAGQRSSTEFIFPISSIFDNTAYTAEGLGVSMLQYPDGTDYFWAIYSFYDRVMPDVGQVMHALMIDCPFDLYWFDKTLDEETQTGGVRWYYVPYVIEGDTIWIDGYDTGSFTVCFTVAKEYSQSGQKGTYTFDTSYAEAVKAAADNARQIIEKNKNRTDREKLFAYKDAICSLVDYNHTAAEDENTSYGNAWQLIWIFDGDPKTHVVCEGYSKGFQYLCDLSTFTEGTACVSVDGSVWLKDGNSVRHMWNLVTYQGQRYLADVTNCDEGTIGYPGKLFLKGYSSRTEGTYPVYTYDVDGREIHYQYDSDVTGLMPTEELSVADDPVGVDDGTYTSGKCGESLTWQMSSDGKLRISGSGMIAAYGTGEGPWWNKALVKKVFLTGEVTGIGSGAFTDCPLLTWIRLVSGITEIAGDAFDPRDMNTAKDPRTFEIPACTDTWLIHWVTEQYYNHTASHSKLVRTPAKDPTCTEAGHTSGLRCDACGSVFQQVQEIAASGHSWGNPVYSWAADNRTVTAVRICDRDEAHREEETAVTTVTETPATATAAGKIIYRAEFRNSAFNVQTREIILPALPVETDPPTEQPEQPPADPPNDPPGDQPAEQPGEQPTEQPTEAEEQPGEQPAGKYTIQWRNIDGTLLEEDAEVPQGTIPIYHGQTPFLAADAEQSWVFTGWDPPVAEVTGDITYTAQYAPQRHNYILKLPAGSRRIEAEAFMGGAFEAVIIPEGCTKIGKKAFADCLNLVYIRIPASVKSIAEDAFEGCGPLTVDRSEK